MTLSQPSSQDRCTSSSLLDPLTASLPHRDSGLDGLLVAVVDDVIMVRESICQILEKRGIRTMEASGLKEFKTLLLANHPDMLITDYRLEDGATGFDVILAAHEISKIPCFMVTGDTSPDLVAEMSKSDVEVVYKPLRAKALLEALQRALTRP